MRTLVFSSQTYDRDSFLAAARPDACQLQFHEARLTEASAALASGCEVVCAFINDELSAPVLERLAAGGTRLIALRSAGYNHVDLRAAHALGLRDRGQLAAGQRADFVAWDLDHPNELAYWFGHNPCRRVIAAGLERT